MYHILNSVYTVTVRVVWTEGFYSRFFSGYSMNKLFFFHFRRFLLTNDALLYVNIVCKVFGNSRVCLHYFTMEGPLYDSSQLLVTIFPNFRIFSSLFYLNEA